MELIIQQAITSMLHFQADNRLPSEDFLIRPVMNPTLFFPDKANTIALLHDEKLFDPASDVEIRLVVGVME